MWQFGNESWEQDEEGCVFTLKQLNECECDDEIAAPLDMLIGAKKHPPTKDSACSNKLFPSKFSHCPICGEVLLDNTKGGSGIWIPPYGPGNGLKILQKEVKPESISAENGDIFPVPPTSGPFCFFSSRLRGSSRLLLAIQRDVGQIWVYNPNSTKTWLPLKNKIGASTMPNWSWSLAIDPSETGCAFPSDAGPVWVTVNWATNSLRIDRANGISVGSPVRVGKSVLAPIMREGKFSVLNRSDSENKWFECTALSDPISVEPQLRRQPDQDAYLGIPVVDEIREVVFWPCRGGYVKVSGLESSGPGSWEFRPWETDVHPATALIELGSPLHRTTGLSSRRGFWQLCEDHEPSSRDGVVYKIIKFDGDPAVDFEVVECGQFVSSGRASFSWLYDYWNDVHQRNLNVGDQIEIRYPLLQFGEKGVALLAKLRSWQGKEDMGSFTEDLFSQKQKTSTFVRFVIEGSSTPESGLYAVGVGGAEGAPGSLFRILVSQLAEISAFIYDAKLHIYFPDENKCFYWPISWAEM